ncbi:MAG: alpha/beta fold hydrolase [Candidatus Nitrosopolaris sp.]
MKSLRSEESYFIRQCKNDDVSAIVCSTIDIASVLSCGDMPLNKSWHDYNESLIKRGRVLIDVSFLKSSTKEIKKMNKGKAREGDKDNDNDRIHSTTPLLIVYAFINRHYILDLLPEISVVGNLLRQGFDVFATDWGTPSAYDKDLTIGHFVNSYMDRSVDLIREITKSDKVSLFGYCWGGNLVLIYAALHPEKVKNVITIVTPGDFSLDDTLLSVWTKSMDVDTLLNAFGNVPRYY